MRQYSKLDLLRFRRYANENPDLKPIQLIKGYDEKYPELSEEQKLKNIKQYLHIELSETNEQKD